MTIPSPGRPTITVRLGLDDMSCVIDALEGTAHLDTTDEERDHDPHSGPASHCRHWKHKGRRSGRLRHKQDNLHCANPRKLKRRNLPEL